MGRTNAKPQGSNASSASNSRSTGPTESSGSDKDPDIHLYEQKIEDSLKELNKKIRKSFEKKEKLDDLLQNVGSLYEKIRNEKRLSNYHKSKLKTLYLGCQKESELEADGIRECLALISRIRKLKTEKRVASRRVAGAKERTGSTPIRRGALMVMLQHSAATLPLWVGFGQSPPPSCGAIPGTELSLGDALAALVKGEDGEDNWILAELVAIHPESGRYEVDDVDEEQKERHVLGRQKLIPLPTMRANPDTDPQAVFPRDAVVLALYPQTTCFYKGVVERVPATHTDDYLVAFEDASYPNGFSPPLPVPQRYVVAFTYRN